MAFMRDKFVARLVYVWFALALLTFAGCESPEWTRSLNDSFSAAEKTGPKTEEEHRREYVATHSHESMRWLLSHRVQTGMSYNQVRHVLGEDGTLETGDRKLMTGGGNYRVGDEMYAFGPDSKGKTVYLAFRENRLVNFEPSEFK
jgi:hypothetical protein